MLIGVPVIARPIVRPGNVWTRGRSGARIREAVVSVKRVGARGREVLDIRSDCATECVGNLGRRIGDNDVATDDIARHLPASPKIEPVDVSDNPVMLNHIVLAYTQESETEIVAVGTGGGRQGSSCTVAKESVQPNSVVAAAGKSSSAARCSV